MTSEQRAPDLEQRLADVQERISRACRAAGRAANEVRLIAVSKRQPASAVRAAYDLGVRDFGENYAQELASKQAELADLSDIRWHMIGHLQTNKARLVAPIAHAVHTLDSLKLLVALVKRAEAADRRLEVFIEVNLAGEAQKAGCAPERIPELVAAFANAPRIRLVGLMAIPPSRDSEAETRLRFQQLRRLAEAQHPPLPRLSMGMSGDYELAIAEGATDVRIGTAIFGERGPPNPTLEESPDGGET